ncbi:hypothetical protein B5F99_09395 [Odoribacter splanchnicus]|nr:hypothetical protein B5F99_09395 [Odoribacter splanchnicus]
MTTKQTLEQQKSAMYAKIKPGFITSNCQLGEERPGLRCKYNTTCSNMDGLGTVYLERICIAEQILCR